MAAMLHLDFPSPRCGAGDIGFAKRNQPTEVEVQS